MHPRRRNRARLATTRIAGRGGQASTRCWLPRAHLLTHGVPRELEIHKRRAAADELTHFRFLRLSQGRGRGAEGATGARKQIRHRQQGRDQMRADQRAGALSLAQRPQGTRNIRARETTCDDTKTTRDDERRHVTIKTTRDDERRLTRDNARRRATINRRHTTASERRRATIEDDDASR